jgi:hypothetical protein
LTHASSHSTTPKNKGLTSKASPCPRYLQRQPQKSLSPKPRSKKDQTMSEVTTRPAAAATKTPARVPAAPAHFSEQATYRHRAGDIETVFETLAVQCEALRRFSADIQARLQDKGSITQAGNDLTIIQHMAALMGSICEEMGCGTGNFIGGPASWATKDGIEAIEGVA